MGACAVAAHHPSILAHLVDTLPPSYEVVQCTYLGTQRTGATTTGRVATIIIVEEAAEGFGGGKSGKGHQAQEEGTTSLLRRGKEAGHP